MIILTTPLKLPLQVYTYRGEYVRVIGGLGSTNYPISVSIGPQNEVLVMDNHTNFNVTMFNREGFLMAAVQSDLKHNNQCHDACLMPNGCVVVSTKDQKIHVYSLPQYFFKNTTAVSAINQNATIVAATTGQRASFENNLLHVNNKVNNQFKSQTNNHLEFLNQPLASLDQLSLETKQQILNNFEIQSQIPNNICNTFTNNHCTYFNSTLSDNIPFILDNPFNNYYNSNTNDSNPNNNYDNNINSNNSFNFNNNNNINPNTETLSTQSADLLISFINNQLLSPQNGTSQQSLGNSMMPCHSPSPQQSLQPSPQLNIHPFSNHFNHSFKPPSPQLNHLNNHHSNQLYSFNHQQLFQPNFPTQQQHIQQNFSNQQQHIQPNFPNHQHLNHTQVSQPIGNFPYTESLSAADQLQRDEGLERGVRPSTHNNLDNPAF